MPQSNKKVTDYQIIEAKHMLDLARNEGDRLKIDLREAALNDLLERYDLQISRLPHVTSKGRK